MITRIFRVQINPELCEEFEELYRVKSIDAVQGAEGYISVTIGKPTIWAPDEYVMISTWINEVALKEFAGERWNEAHIPAGMEKFIVDCWVHHYEAFDR
ncbi:antibiotic biosynthesis monooxygenase family protein [Kiloniella majae]|uniref:antibiotic biosynthesis monooxygenase family protein n=1 Tax=Kiloniella majae TaxID=1938558 RepID=UPI000A27956E|nr:antibiotic biosynthesis monooxygenase [Kiloniella majae]